MSFGFKVGSLKIPVKAVKILEQYIEQKDGTGLVFPNLKELSDLTDKYHMQMRIKTKSCFAQQNIKRSERNHWNR